MYNAFYEPVANKVLAIRQMFIVLMYMLLHSNTYTQTEKREFGAVVNKFSIRLDFREDLLAKYR